MSPSSGKNLLRWAQSIELSPDLRRQRLAPSVSGDKLYISPEIKTWILPNWWQESWWIFISVRVGFRYVEKFSLLSLGVL
jgi:hypothetical protein